MICLPTRVPANIDARYLKNSDSEGAINDKIPAIAAVPMNPAKT